MYFTFVHSAGPPGDRNVRTYNWGEPERAPPGDPQLLRCLYNNNWGEPERAPPGDPQLLRCLCIYNYIYILVGECSAFLASGSDPTDDSCMKHIDFSSPGL